MWRRGDKDFGRSGQNKSTLKLMAGRFLCSNRYIQMIVLERKQPGLSLFIS